MVRDAATSEHRIGEPGSRGKGKEEANDVFANSTPDVHCAFAFVSSVVES